MEDSVSYLDNLKLKTQYGACAGSACGGTIFKGELNPSRVLSLDITMLSDSER